MANSVFSKLGEDIMSNCKPEMLLRAEVANILRISTVTLARWAMKSTGPGFVKIGGRCLYPRDKLEQWIEEQGR